MKSLPHCQLFNYNSQIPFFFLKLPDTIFKSSHYPFFYFHLMFQLHQLFLSNSILPLKVLILTYKLIIFFTHLISLILDHIHLSYTNMLFFSKPVHRCLFILGLRFSLGVERRIMIVFRAKIVYMGRSK